MVVLHKDPALTKEDLLAHRKLQLAGDKLQRSIDLRIEPLRKASVGKILRRELHDGSAASP